MQILEVKNNLVKIGFEPTQEELVLSGFLALKPPLQDGGFPEAPSFIGQVMHLEATSKGHFAILKLLFNFDSTGVVVSYNGAIPELSSTISYVETKDLIGLLPVQTPIVIGEVAHQNTILKLDGSLFDEKLLVCLDKESENNLLVKNINAQLTNSGRKVLVIDLIGELDFSQNRVVAGEDFSLPLNYDTINFIYEKGLEGANPETKALIQEIFLEVQNYVKTTPEGFIPFETFKNVVDEQYRQLEIVELVLLKNKLLKYLEDGVFAQKSSQFESLQNSLERPETTILDLSKVEENVQREVVSYAYSLFEKAGKEIYVLLKVDNSSSDKKLLKQIYCSKTAHTTVVCSYSYKYLNELKQLAKNLILFAPIVQQKDFASYNTFLNKLNPDEFIIYGHATNNLPLIVKLDDTPQKTFDYEAAKEFQQPQYDAVVAAEAQQEFEPVQYEAHGFLEQDFAQEELMQVPSGEELLDEQIRKDVDEIYTAPAYEKQEQEFAEESFVEEGIEGLTEEDLDFIDDLSIVNEEVPHNQDFFNDEADEDFQVEVLPDEEEVFPSQETTSFQHELELGQVQQDEEYESFENVSSIVREEPSAVDILPASEAYIPSVPIYEAEVDSTEAFASKVFEQGDSVFHSKYGKGTVEKMISYGNKTLCSINFDNVGRRLLDPSLAELKKV